MSPKEFLNNSLRRSVLILLLWRLSPTAGPVRHLKSGLKLTRRSKEQHFQIVFQRAGIKTRHVAVNISPLDPLQQALVHQMRLQVLKVFQIVVFVLVLLVSIRVEIG